MARSAHFSSSGGEEDDLYSGPSSSTNPRESHRAQNPASLSPSPAASFSSDKENRQASTAIASRQDKGKSRANTMAPPKPPTPESEAVATPRTTKRRKLGDRDAPQASQVAHARVVQESADTQFYDPDQDVDERRAVRKGLRDLTRDLNDSRAEYLAAGSTGLVDTLSKANEYFNSVKQTSDATIDSRLLVSAADLSYKKTAQLTLGDTSQGVDVDEFVSKCITFMRTGPRAEGDGPQIFSSGRRRNRGNGIQVDGDVSGAEDSADEGDALNWEWLGRKACFPHNIRPPVPGFLLGPLSVQKRVRAPTQRRERLQKRNPADAVRPEELKVTDLEKVENSNLTTLCKRIREVLVKIQTEGQARVNAEAEAKEDISDDEIRQLMVKYGICDDAGVSLFRFVINPLSFGQTVENLFYVSFLIRDGTVGVGKDGNGLPTLHASAPRKSAEIKEQSIQKHQAVFSLDMSMWTDLIEAFDITESMIPNRKSDEGAQVSATGWYG
ncbi:MAG: nuclear protein [Pycnora praestabilis]|nr:MAG: nuclear protein [Pycnora praestabilis]